MTSRRPWTWRFETFTGVSGGGTTIVVAELVPTDAYDQVEACDVVHNGAVATDLAIGLFQAGRVVLFRSSATDPARPAAGVPVVLDRAVITPPGWQLIGAANNLALNETITLRVLTRRILL